MVLSWLLNSVSKEIAGSITYINTSRDMWIDLKERFSRKNGPCIYQLKKAISSLSQEQVSVNAYYTKLKALWDELSNYGTCTCGNQKSEYVSQFLMGLNDSISYIRGQILLLDPLPSITRVFSLIVQDEEQ